MIEYEVYCASHFAGLRDLFGQVWGEPRSVEYDQKHWNQTIAGIAPAVVAIAENRIIGFYMVWPIPLSDGSNVVLGGQPIDSMLDRSFQGQGLLRELGSRCYLECAKRGIGVMYGAPNKAAIPGNVGGLNWSHVSNIVDYVRPIIRRRRINDLLMNIDKQDLTLDGIAMSTSAVSLELIAHFCSDNRSESKARKTWRVPSSPEWFSYRYRSTPDVRYVGLTLDHGNGILGAAICGIRFGDVESKSASKLTIGELAGKDASARRAIVAGTIRLAAAVGAPYIMTKSVGVDLGSSLIGAGFLPIRRKPLISRTLDPRCYRANPLSKNGWALFGGAFDTI